MGLPLTSQSSRHVSGEGPNGFARRLLLLGAVSGLAFTVLGAQALRLGVGRRDDAIRQVEERLVRTVWTHAVRGDIVDRRGRVLATDRPSYSVAFPFAVINGDWADAEGTRAARRAAGRRWLDLSPAERDELVGAHVGLMRVHLEGVWDRLAMSAGVSRAEVDVQRDRVIRMVEARQAAVTRARYDREVLAAYESGSVPTEEQRRAILRRAEGPIAERRGSHVLISGIGDDAAFRLRVMEGDEIELAAPPAFASILGEDAKASGGAIAVQRMPGMSVRDRGDRDYPLSRVDVEVPRTGLPGPLRSDEPARVTVDGVAGHVLGRMRARVYSEDQAARDAWLTRMATSSPALAARVRTPSGVDRGEYREGDLVGEAGIERSQESELRGLRGLRSVRIDTGATTEVAAEQGRTVALTIDAMLQARVQAIMSPEFGLARVQPWHQQESLTQQPGDVLNGAAVVLDVDSGDVLAMVSLPSFTLEELRDDPEALVGDSAALRVSQPMVNRAVSKPYQPGSVVKPLILLGAEGRGNYALDQRIECTGHLIPNRPDMFRCWIFKRYNTTHMSQLGHALLADEAISVSCNIFFYTLGRRLGPEGIVATYRSFGVGEPLDLGVDLVYAGALGSEGDVSGIGSGDAAQMGIGQGPVAWTPLHAADAYATLARGGIRITPRLLRDAPRGEPRDIGASRGAVDMALRGLWLAVNDTNGTGHALTADGVREPIFNVPGVKVWGKTGTAHASPIVGDPDGEGPAAGQILEQGDHSWFVVLAGRDRPTHAIAVVTDFGGSGGKVSGPIANEIVRALVDEGYIEPAAASSGAGRENGASD
jgi:cell division protein FtsI/penicillin-binding protein 2